MTLALYGKGIQIAFSGIGTTLAITGAAVVIGVFVGLFVALARLSQSSVLRGIGTVYVEILRGTPLLVQALLLYNGLPMLIRTMGGSFRWDSAVVCGMLACGINSSAYVSESIRAGLQAVDKGQTEAARSLGMSGAAAYRFVIVPQAFRIVLPALGNEFVSLIKETSVLSAIGVVEVTRKGMLWTASSFNAWPAFIGVAICYLCITIPCSKGIRLLEAHLAKSDRK